MDKRLLIILTGLFFAVSVSAERVDLGTGVDGVNVVVEQSDFDHTVVRFDIGTFDMEAIDINGETYNLLKITKEPLWTIAGEPSLPKLCRSIIIPDDARMEIHILKSEYVDFQNTPVAPSKGHLLRTVNPELVQYTFGDVYREKEFYPGPVADIRAPYILRDYRGTVIELNAFQYNPGTQTLRVYTSVTVEVVNVGPGEINVLNRDKAVQNLVPDFELIYKRRFINYEQRSDKYPMAPDAGDILIISYDAFMPDMQPYVDWKMQKGIKTTMVPVSTMGNTTTAIDDYIQDFYDSTNLAFVLLVGDGPQVTTFTSGGGAADPLFALVAGSDSYPDIIIGRFSAENSADVATQVERTISYESEPLDGTWFHKGTGIASSEGPGHFGEYDFTHIGYIRNDLLAYTYSQVDEIYDPGGTSSQVSTVLNEGRSVINYCGHGSTTSWGTTGFNNSNVDALVNDNMLPFIIAVACLNGQFRDYTCFAEAWMRATHSGGEPTGAIGCYMSSINQSWNPPMYAQDEVNDLLVSEALSSYGALCYSGSAYMNEVEGTDGVAMYETWHIFGDPSVQVRTDTPQEITVIHDGVTFFNMSEYEVEVVGVEGALCALYANGTLYGSAYTGSDGMVIVPISEELPLGGPILLTVTAYNKVTVIDTVIAATDIAVLHDPIGNSKDTLNPYEIICTVISDTTLVADQLLLMYQINSVWAADTLELVLKSDDYVGYIPAQVAGTVVDYYLYVQNEAGGIDSTETFSFKVIDYGLLLGPEYSQLVAPVNDTVWFDLTVTNDGVLEDDYALGYSCNNWDVSLWDADGIAEISSTASLVGDATFDFQVRVLIPSSFEDEYDSVVVTATSNEDLSYSAAASIKAISAGQPWAIPFVETFPGMTFDMTRWEITTNATISVNGINEPSSPYSANMNGYPSGGDTIMTEQINLRNENNIVLKYFYQRKGGGDSPELGDDLIVEYVDSLGVWHVIDQQPGEGEDMTDFVEAKLALPPDACHAGFRVMFHNSASTGSYDDWFIDDIYVGYPSDYDITLLPGFQTQYGPAGDTAAYLLSVVNMGLLDDQYNMSRSSGFWNVSFYDEVGSTQITSTGLIPAGDSVNIIVKVAIPESADVNTEDSSVISLQSQNDITASSSAKLVTKSGGFPLEFPWSESFAFSNLSTDWFTNVGAVISQDGLAPPSPPYSINLDGGNDTVTTRMVDLSGSSGAVLSYYFQRGGNGEPPETGDDLSIDYKNEFGEWIEFQVHEGDGTAMTKFEYVNIPLPANAVHSGFQLRMRSVGTSADSDDWYMDDIHIDYAPAISVSPSLILEYMVLSGEVSQEIVIDNAGPGELIYSIQVQQLPIQWLTMDTLSGVVEPGFSDTILCQINTAGLDSGSYNATITVISNDPDTGNNPFVIPVTLNMGISGPPWICGDIDGSGPELNISDLVYLVDFMFNGGDPPPTLEAADVNGSGGNLDISDLVYFVDYMFNGGPAPTCGQ